MSGSVIVETAYGPVVGIDDSGCNHKLNSIGRQTFGKVPVRKFLGIPYGQAERWKRVQPPTPWTEPLICHQFGPSLPQFPFTPFDRFYSTPILVKSQSVQSDQKGFTVNIFCSPETKEGDNVPVLGWVYGGALLHGCSSIEMYDPTEWVRREASKGNKFIVVTGNFRMNLLGFLACSDLAEEDPDGLAGNYGAYDCIAYFQWIQKNIAKFGGDPNNVTAFGESAGAFLLTHLMLCKEKLFRRVILQSGAPKTCSYMSMETHEEVYEGLLQKASIKAESGAARLKALRDMPIEELISHLSVSVREVAMVVENGSCSKVIWSEPCTLSRLKAGHWSSHIESVIIGVCKDEGAILSYVSQSHTPAGYKFVQQEFLAGVTEQELGPLYDHPNQAEIDNPPSGSTLDLTRCSGAMAMSDKLFNAPVELFLGALDEAKNEETQKPLSIYFYMLEGTAVESMPPGLFFGAAHTVDVALLFNMSHCWAPDSESAKVSATLGNTWYKFARDGSPGLDWPEYQRQSSPYRLVFHQDGGSSIQDLRDRPEIEKQRIKFWVDQLQLNQFWQPPPPLIGILDSSSADSSEGTDEKNHNKTIL
ncbi:hypothetical protein PCANC_24199 [Puccinia coronata f. sp. avenae]|uniref:Carboxylesterase type B domain-containing protein n=1 Tax=Puccinia coronata f. sp. avenae TaxID=200324 RepID=A0A2N5SCJ1_9BASI|nr:hypothetical protein PCANC_24199 [Puccinia coronata f. sp. avenae]